MDFFMWEKFFMSHEIKALVELGTGSGTFSLFFMLQAIQHGFGFITFDIERPSILQTALGRLTNLDAHCIVGDVFDKAKPFVEAALTGGERPILLYCDNGDKPKEIETFFHLMHTGDYLVVHDWDSEIFIKDMPKQIIDCTPLEAIDIGSKTRWFEVKR